MIVNKMVIKLDNANTDIRRHEEELRRLSRECAPMMHGHPTLRRRITNELQPQINKLNHELRAIKEGGVSRTKSTTTLEHHALHEMQKQISTFQRQITTVERNQQIVSKNEMNQDFLAHKLITNQKLDNIVRDVGSLSNKVEQTERALEREKSSDAKIISEFQGVIDKLMVSFDQKLSLVRGELKEIDVDYTYCVF